MKIRKIVLILFFASFMNSCNSNINQPGLNQPPAANAGSDRTVIAGMTVSFDSSGCSDLEDTMLNCIWNLGDGNTKEGSLITHIYTAPGTYTVKLTVTDSGGLFDEDTIEILVTEESPVGRIAAHEAVYELWQGLIPEDDIIQAKEQLKIGYGHTSHGSQITTGMAGLVTFANKGKLETAYSGDLFSFNSNGAEGALTLLEGGGGILDQDVGSYPEWINRTQDFLDNPAYDDFNVIMWSWCGQVSEKSEQSMLDEYLSPMAALEAANPEITFIYMTGHLDGTGKNGNLHLRNEQIRKFCLDNNKWLFDFADIESYDPENNYYLDDNADDSCNYTGGNWAKEWQERHILNTDWYECGAAHSQPLNANMKAYAAWWLFVQIAADMKG